MSDLRSIPSVDSLLGLDEFKQLRGDYGDALVVEVVRESLAEFRQGLQRGPLQFQLSSLVEQVTGLLVQKTQITLKPVINATGVILHWMSSCVRLAAMMPASRATAMTSPLGAASEAIERERLRRHDDGRLGARHALGLVLAADVHHGGAAAVVEVAEPRASSPSDLGHRPLVGQGLAAAVEGLAGHGRADRRAQAVRIAEQRPDVGLAAGEQAGAQPAVGREAQAVAGLAEVVGHAGDEADGAASARDLPVLRRPVAVRAVVADEHVLLHEPAQHVPRGEQPPLAAEVLVTGDAAVERHELDEAHVDVVLARERDEGVQLLLHARQQQGVDLDRREPGGEGGVDAGERVVEVGRRG